MCGIIGYVGKDNAKDVIISGLKSLEYRGYDSSGIAYVINNQVNIIKSEGKVSNLENKLKNNIKSSVAIGHTRWATHGKPSEINAHPHSVGMTTIVHNGIIENYVELKRKLEKYYVFKSETDTEVACALIDYLYSQLKDKFKALIKAKEMIKGSYAFAIIFSDEINALYAIRKDSPLILAEKNNESFIASDIAAILKYTNEYYLLNQNEIAKLDSNGIVIYNDNLELVKKKKNIYNGTSSDVMKNGHKHFMMKEMYDEVDVYKNIIKSYVPNYHIQDLEKSFGDYSKYKKITIVGCGSAYHVGMVAKNIFEEYVNIPASAVMASEYRYGKIFPSPNELVIFISQSGETADTLEALRKARQYKLDTLGIINVYSSSIARESGKVIYSLAGCEIAVATTKAYLAQSLILSLLSILMAYQKKQISKDEANKYLKDLKHLPNYTKQILDNKEEYEILAKKLYHQENMFFIGRNIDYALCMEGSLKMKEISYIHSEAYAAGELKHGTISLIENNTPVIGIVTKDDIASKTISNLKETKARGSNIILVTTEKIFKDYKNDNFYDDSIVVKNINSFFQSLLIITPLQLLSYYVALYRKESIDQPRNLAKSVTVE